MPTSSQQRRPRAGAPRRRRRRCSVRSASVMKSPIVRTGLMCARGSWKTIATSPRYAAQRARRAARGTSRPSNADRPARLGARAAAAARSRGRSSTCPSPTRRPARRASPAPIVSETSCSTVRMRALDGQRHREVARPRAAAPSRRPPRACGRRAGTSSHGRTCSSAAPSRNGGHVVVGAADDLHAGRHAVVGEAGRAREHRAAAGDVEHRRQERVEVERRARSPADVERRADVVVAGDQPAGPRPSGTTSAS